MSLAGYIWLAWSYFMEESLMAGHTDICIFRKLTALPCPSCGTTRSVLSLAGFNLSGALQHNPLGLPAALSLIVFPVWITGDLLLGKTSFMRFYRRTELLFRKKWVAAAFAVLILANWAWNILKYT
jgi:hypothetical protein